MKDRQLYKDSTNAKLTGVCAGIANYFGVEIWLVRILVVSVTLFTGIFLVLVAYIAFSLMLEKQPNKAQQTMKIKQEHKIKDKAWQAGQTPDNLLNNIERDLKKVDQGVRSIEAYVTSESFNINREFRNL